MFTHIMLLAEIGLMMQRLSFIKPYLYNTGKRYSTHKGITAVKVLLKETIYIYRTSMHKNKSQWVEQFVVMSLT